MFEKENTYWTQNSWEFHYKKIKASAEEIVAFFALVIQALSTWIQMILRDTVLSKTELVHNT